MERYFVDSCGKEMVVAGHKPRHLGGDREDDKCIAHRCGQNRSERSAVGQWARRSNSAQSSELAGAAGWKRPA
jgi:hypothetical protein